MALKLLVKPNEKLFVGSGSILVVADTTVTIIVDGDMPVLREADYLPLESARTPVRRFYFTLQSMYLSGDVERERDNLHSRARELLQASPNDSAALKEISDRLDGALYKAIKLARALVQKYEHAENWAAVITS